MLIADVDERRGFDYGESDSKVVSRGEGWVDGKSPGVNSNGIWAE